MNPAMHGVRLPTINMQSSSNPMLQMQNMFMHMVGSMQRNARGGDAFDPDMPLTMLRQRSQLALGNLMPHSDGAQPHLAAIADGSASPPDSAGGSADGIEARTAAGIAKSYGKSASGIAAPSAAAIGMDVDRMLNDGAAIDAPPAKKTKVRTAAAAGVMKRPASQPASVIFDRSSPPKFGTQCPCVFNNCRIYEVSTKFRVVPAPDRSAYDRGFQFTAATKKDVWNTLIKYCRDPFIPKDSKNYVKIGKL
jgi:hypothetical protein